MNCTYRSIWNETSATFVAVSENAKSAGKKTSSCRSATGAGARLQLQTLAVAMMLSFASNVFALPAGGAVVAGGASISTGAGSTIINQTTQNAAINWQSFNVATGEAVIFKQPNSTSVILNRVLGADPSSILGSMSANGKVFLVNPNGILFGKGASVNVGGLVASTLNITDSDFMAGSYKFSGGSQGSVRNLGSISAAGGYVALLGANVSNDGVISAQLGTVAFAAGNAITLDVAGDGLLNVTVNQGAVNALVQNGGLIQADGGQVLLTARSAASLLPSAVNNTGVIRAQTLVTGKDGSIKLIGDMQSGTVNVGGTLDASAPNGGDGGFIETSAANVKVANGSLVTTMSSAGKTGKWLIDPQDFSIGIVATDNISGATLSSLLVTNNVVITTDTGPRTDVAGTPPVSTLNTATIGNGDINVNQAISWTATPSTTTLSLFAARDVNINAAISATNGNLLVCCGHDTNVNAAITTVNGSVLLSAANNINVAAAMTTTNGNIAMGAGSNITVGSKITMTHTTGIIPSQSLGLPLGLTLSAGNNGVSGGTVIFAPLAPNATVTDALVTVNYSPTSYATPTNFSSNFTLTGTELKQHMVVSLQGNNKVYDGNTTATLSIKGNPALAGNVLLVSGSSATAVFDDKNAASNIGISYSDYSLGGANANLFSLPVFYCPALLERTSGNISPAPLILTANNATKVYGTTFTLASTAFTRTAMVGSDTVISVAETSTGSATSASVAGSTYPIVITPGSAAGNFIPTNYTISYVNGALTVTPAPLTVTANNSSKTFGQTPALTGFTTTPLANGETIGSVTETSPGSVATAPVAGSPYAITPSGATGGTFTPSNYTIAYNNGVLTVAPAVAPPVPTPPVVTPPVVLPPVENSPGGVPPAGNSPGGVPPAENSPGVVPPVENPPGVVPPVENSPGAVPPVTPVTWAPVVTPQTTPPELLTLVPPSPVATPPTAPPELMMPVSPSPPSPVPVFVPTPIVTPVAPPPALYVAPVHLRKQDRN